MPAVLHTEAMVSWVLDFGSARLHMAHQTGYLQECIGVYRSERLARERPKWKFMNLESMTSSQQKQRFTKIHNPSEAALKALIDARERYDEEGNSILLKNWYAPEQDERSELLVQTFLGRTAGIDVPDYHRWLASEKDTAALQSIVG